jgi:hypothetical protein
MLSELAAAIFAGLLFKIIEDTRKQRELVAILIALKNECSYNTIYRGDEKCPFQKNWLHKALETLEFHEQCDDFTKEALETFELINDANLGQLARRGMVPSDIQGRMYSISNGIDTILPSLKTRIGILGYLKWRYSFYRNAKNFFKKYIKCNKNKE